MAQRSEYRLQAALYGTGLRGFLTRNGVVTSVGECDPLFCGPLDAHTVEASPNRAQIPLYYANLPGSVVLGFLRNVLSPK